MESEVLHLRANEANFLKKIQELEAHIFYLQEAVKRNGIELPALEYRQSAPGSEANLPLASSKANVYARDVSTSYPVFHNADYLNDNSK